MKSKNIQILLIDDDKSYCLLVKRALTKPDHSTGFALKTAHSLAEGLKLLGAEAIDLVLLDLGLPDSFGLDTFDSVRNAAPEVSIVMLTGLEDEQVSIEAIKRGASDYLIKGKDSFADILIRTVLHAVERKRTEQTLRVNERNFRNIINKSADAVIVTDENGIILFANDAVDSLFGWNSKELLGKSFGHPITTGRTCEIELTRKSGGAATAEMRVVETTWQGSRACFVSLHDITSRKATEKKMAKYRDNLKALVEVDKGTIFTIHLPYLESSCLKSDKVSIPFRVVNSRD